MSGDSTREVISIKKYPNRRFYDATRSRHVTLQEVHDLIIAGHDVCVTDSRTGDDITNLVLTQILLEKDQPKLDLFPASILHMMIRTNRNALRATFERFYSPFLNLMATSQKQMDNYLRKAMHGQMLTPMDWAREMMHVFSGAKTQENGAGVSPPEPSDDAEIEELREQLTALKRRLDSLSADREAADREHTQ